MDRRDTHPIADLAAKMAVSRRLLELADPPEGMDAIVFQMVQEELAKDMPRLEAKMVWLRSQAADRRIRDAQAKRRAA